MELTSHYIPFLNEDVRDSHRIPLVLQKLLRTQRQRYLAVLTISLFCFCSVIIGFFWLHSFNNLNDFPVYKQALLRENFEDQRLSQELLFALDEVVTEWSEQKFKDKFHHFVSYFKKKYFNDKEREKRFSIFKKNMYYIDTHNRQGFDYTLRINQFGDLTNEEFKMHYVGYKKMRFDNSNSFKVATDLLDYSNDDLPSSVNWKNLGCVTEVKNQQRCGSCWAFSSTGALEGALCAKSGKLLDLSEQQLVDCAQKEGNEGCEGGEMANAFQYVIDNKGLCSEKDYSYEAKEGVCREKNCTSVINIKGYKVVPHSNEIAMKMALKNHGPVSVAIEADQLPFQFYHKGVFSASCGTDLDHGVLLVGYGNDKKFNKDFWEIKNSWGEGWGEKGFMRLAMHHGKSGECGVLMEGIFPEL